MAPSVGEAERRKFLEESWKFLKEFDSIAEDLFQGELMERLATSFVARHESVMRTFPFALSEVNLDEASTMDLVKDDFRLMNLEVSQDEGRQVRSAIKKASATRQDVNLMLAQIYSRASMASYLRVTFNKSRKNQEDDRQVPVDWARRAIRYDANDFRVAYWFMIAIGWQLEGMANSKERIIVSQIFKLSALQCIRLKPDDPLAHHLLGRYFFNVGNLTWLERTVIKTLILHHPSGQFKIEGSYEEAEAKFKHAHSLKDDWPPTGLWMARTLLAQKRPLHEVAHWIEMGLAHECKEPTTEIERRELLDLKAKLKL